MIGCLGFGSRSKLKGFNFHSVDFGSRKFAGYRMILSSEILNREMISSPSYLNRGRYPSQRILHILVFKKVGIVE